MEKPKFPIICLIEEGNFLDLCDSCGSSLKMKHRPIRNWLGMQKEENGGCINPECDYYWEVIDLWDRNERNWERI